MPRLQSFELEIKTGERGLEDTPRYSINGFVLEFDESNGGTGPGETLTVTGSPDSYPHTLHLAGPESGRWDIDSIRATYYPAGEEPYTVRYGAVSLDDQSDLNIYHARPARVFDV